MTAGFVHDAVVFDSDDELLAVAGQFIRSGVAQDELVLVDLGPAHASTYRDLFAAEPNVLVTEGLYTRPVETLRCLEAKLRRARAEGLGGARSVGAVDFGTSPSRWREWVHYESVLNEVFASQPWRGLCAYDRRTLPHEIVESARLTHPHLIEHRRRQPSPVYAAPREFARQREYRIAADPLQSGPPHLELVDVADVADMRVDLHLASMCSDGPRARFNDFLSAVNELATNGLVHGRRPVTVRVWVAPDRWVGTVTDRGPGIADPLQGFRRPLLDGSPQQLGLWAVRQLCDVVDFEHTTEGFTVRVVVRDGG
jgi:anti-sigma regulatory factor (Ser/Thr protein kinase)